MTDRNSRWQAALAARVLTACALMATAGTAPAAGQTQAPAAGVVAGRVVDAVTGSPMAGATVVLEPEGVGVFPASAAGSAFAAAARSTVTDSAGRYRFAELTPGPYRLYAARYGYRPYAVVVELARASMAVSVGLEAEPIALEPMRGRGHGRGPYVSADPFGSDAEVVRLLVSDLRRGRFLSTDVRELTSADVVESVTLGEPDLFRALQRLPGVTTRSDYTAALWTRGAPWSQTRVYYDGIPVFNPLHALGMISGISSNAVGTVWFHPGVRSAGIAEGAAGVVDLRSRPAAGTGSLNAQADVSLATAGLTLDQRVLDGRAGWMVSGRRTYLDWLSDLAGRAAGSPTTTPFPYHFTETSGRVDARVGDQHAVEASWLWEGDALSSTGTAEEDPLEALWGNAVARATWSAALQGYTLQHTIGGSRHHGSVATEPSSPIPTSSEALRRSETGVAYGMVRGALWPDAEPLASPRWSAGYELGVHSVQYFGPIPLPVPRADALSATESTLTGFASVDSLPVTWAAALPVVALWGEHTWTPTDELTLRAGLRAETGEPVRDAPAIRTSPRLTLRFTPAPEVALSAGFARVYQYGQAVAPGGVQLASLVSTDAWVLAGPGVPPLRSDILTAGLETALAPGRIATINGFGRYTTGVVVPNPQPGAVVGRVPALVIGRGRAAGLEVSVRQLAGPVTGSVSYSLGRSMVDAMDRAYPSAADRPHVLNATGLVRPWYWLRLGAAFTAASGVPFTRAISDPDECAAEPGCDPETLPWAGEPNAIRGPVYASLDLLMDWSAEIAGLHVGVYGQVRNILGRDNATIYVGNGSGCLVVGCSTDAIRNAYERGVPRLPVIGLRVRR